MEESCAVSILIETGRGLLFLKRSGEKKFPGLLTLPGGKMEPGENSLFAAKRELEEELGIKFHRSKLLFCFSAKHNNDICIIFDVFLFKGKIEESQIRLSEEHDEIISIHPDIWRESLAEDFIIPGTLTILRMLDKMKQK